jgi:hypothetical protein
MSERYKLWLEVERQLKIAEQSRKHVNKLGAGNAESDDDFSWIILQMGSDAENQGRALAAESDCLTHIRIPRA